MELGRASVIARGLPRPDKPYSQLKDGRLITHSARETVVLLIDPSRQSVDTLGREGSGPGEYRVPIASQALADGRVAVLDMTGLRMTIWRPDKTLDSILTVPAGALRFDADLDPNRKVYWQDIPAHSPAFLSPGDRPGRHPDSTWLYRIALPGPRYDTVASMIQREAGWIESVFKLPLLHGGQDAWGVLPDGSLWIARVREHRIDRLAPDGIWRQGMPRRWVQVATRPSDVRLIRKPGGTIRDSMPRPMAKVRPPFDYAVASDDGFVWTHLTESLRRGTELLAVFPPSGDSRLTVSLPRGRRIVRISSNAVFALAETDEGEWQLEQYPLPQAVRR